MAKIGLIKDSKFDPEYYHEAVRGNFEDIVHRTVAYKKLFAFDHYIDGYVFDYVFINQNEFDEFITYVPSEISKLQLVKLMIDKGRYDELISAVNLDETGITRILFDATSVVYRDSSMMLSLATLLGFSSEDIDDFFCEAKTILV